MADDTYSILNPTIGFGLTILSTLLFQLLHWKIDSLLAQPKQIKPSKHGEFSFEYWKWKNLCLSWTHALCCGLLVIANMVIYPNYMEDGIEFKSELIYFTLCFTAGYFIYDFIDMWRNSLLRKMWELTTHHVAILIIMIWNIIDVSRLGYTIVALWAEINSFFLHTRKLLQIYKVNTTSNLYTLNTFLNFLTFAVCRFGSCLYLLYGLVVDYHRVTRAYFIFLFAMLFVMSGINPVLFWRLCKSDLLKHRTKANKQDMHFGSPEICKQAHHHTNGNGVSKQE